tara:strand:- start:1813 stop:3387 length:1575 start_codon:yes stop_codon:yes gene_type:complete
MTTILLTGIPKVGKSDLVANTLGLSQQFYEKPMNVLSLGEIVAGDAQLNWHTPDVRTAHIGFSYQQILRSSAISKAANLARQMDDEHLIIDAPMTMHLSHGDVPDIIFKQHQIQELHDAAPIDYIVTLIDDPHVLHNRLRHTHYPSSERQVLDWMAHEVNVAESIYPFRKSEKSKKTPKRLLVIPRGGSDETLVKLLNSEDPIVAYSVGPITDIKENPKDSQSVAAKKTRARNLLTEFRQQLQDFIIPIVPIEIADGKDTQKAKAHTVHRDLYWFVNKSDIVIGYFPLGFDSTGSKAEMQEAAQIGKPTILIHPNQPEKVFGVRPTLYFKTTEDFFDAIYSSREKKYNHREGYDYLRRMLDIHENLPRYCHLRNYAVAIDLLNQEGKHLLVRQAEGKSFPGHWILPGGKKENGETDFQALEREVWQEIGLKLVALDNDPKRTYPYRIFKVDYADANAAGDRPEYFRVYTSPYHASQGQVRADNFVERPEVEKSQWLTTNQILHSRRKVVPGTRQYFADLKKQGK